MRAIQKESLVESVAAEIGERIRSGEIGPALPGVRLLARTLDVSVPTVCRALHGLHNEGILENGGGRRRWRVKAGSPPKKKRTVASSAPKVSSRNSTKNTPKRLLFLTARPLGVEKHSGVEVFAELLDNLTPKGWEVTYCVENFTSAKSPRRSWDEIIRMSRPDAMIVLLGTSVVAEWSKKIGIRTLFLGGDTGDSGVPILKIRIRTMLRQTLLHLLESGHRKILMPLCERLPAFVKNCRDVAMETALSVGIDPKCVTLPETSYSRPEVLVNLLRRHWRRQVPDAMVFLDWREFVAASCFFQEVGIAIPRDVSVILLSQNPDMDWHLPSITHLHHPARTMAKISARWVATGKSSPAILPTAEVKAKWVEGKSVATRIIGG